MEELSLWDKIIAVYPELTDADFNLEGAINLRNDGVGDYIAKWDYDQPIPQGLTLGKPLA